MPYTTINKSSDYFNTVLYTGNGASTHQITGVGFQPDWNWHKIRNDTDWHMVNDAVRGANYAIYPNATNAQGNVPTGLKSFDSDGFTVGSLPDSNQNNGNFVSWNWKANGQGSSNTDGSINTTYTSANTTAGFSIIQYTGNGTGSSTVGHGLGVAPAYVIIKNTSSADAWQVFPTGATRLVLNSTAADYGNNGITKGATTITLPSGVDNAWNTNGQTYIMYCFTEKKGYSSFNKFIGNGSASSGTFIYTGFKPAFVMIKRTDTTGSWEMFDAKREGFNPQVHGLYANLSNAEDNTDDLLDLLSNGFKLYHDGGGLNASGGSYIYMCFAEAPLVGTNNVPCTAR